MAKCGVTDVTSAWGFTIAFDGTGDCDGASGQGELIEYDNTFGAKIFITHMAMWCASNTKVALYNGDGGAAPVLSLNNIIEASASVVNGWEMDFHRQPLEFNTTANDSTALCISAADGFFGGVIQGYKG
jgi:hypothetical protein